MSVTGRYFQIMVLSIVVFLSTLALGGDGFIIKGTQTSLPAAKAAEKEAFRAESRSL